MVPSPRIRLAICGGGIGGLSLAVVLAKHCNDIQIDLYEAQPQFTEIGAGIAVWSRTWVIIQALGLVDMFKQLAVMRPGPCFRKSDQEGGGFNFARLIIPGGLVTLHRADLLKILTDNLPPSNTFHAHFNKRLASYTAKEPNGGVVLHFEDGTVAEADLLVGADGIKSVTRAVMYTELAEKTRDEGLKDFIHATWSGTYAYRALVDSEKVLKVVPHHQAATNPMMYCGKDRHLVTYPISHGRLINIVAFITDPDGEGKKLEGPAVVEVPKQEMLQQYEGWEREVLQLLDSAERVSRWAVSHIRGMPTYVDGLVALLGDSAHPMTPHLGAGAGQAMEDAFILGKLLASPHVTKSNLASVLKIYDTIRVPFGTHFVERSLASGFLCDFNELPKYIDEARLLGGSDVEFRKLTREIYKVRAIQWTDLPDVEWDEAEQMLERLVEGGVTEKAKL